MKTILSPNFLTKSFLVSTLILGFSITYANAESFKDLTMNSKDIKWVKRANGISYCDVWGDPTESSYGQLVKLPGGYSLKNIHHTNNLTVVVNSGKLYVTDEKKKEKMLDAGSYFVRKAETKYSIRCDKLSDCIFFVTQSGMRDFNFSK